MGEGSIRIWACEHLGIGEKHAQINQPFPRFLAWSHQRIFSQKAMVAFNNSDNVLYVLAAMPWEQQEFVWFQVERIEREALTCHIKHLKDELNCVKGMLATVMESSPTIEQNQPPIENQPHENVEQNQLPIPIEKTFIVDLPSSLSKAVKRGKPAKKKAKVAMVDLASSPSKRDKRGRPAKNEGEAAMVDLASSPSKGAMVDLWVDAHFLYQPTADDEAVLVDLRKKWSLATKRVTRRSGVDSNEVAFSTETYEIMGREVSSLLGDQEPDGSSRWISTATTILASAWSTTTQRNKRPKKSKQPIEDDQPGPETVFRSSWIRAMLKKYNRRKSLEQLCVENLGHQDVKTWLLEHKKDIPNQVRYA
uniref:Uncharacterized protein n=1 Tax=Fagus sylvatica TaxID=28930 RepID=A0A2N9HD47_FAGSY